MLEVYLTTAPAQRFDVFIFGIKYGMRVMLNSRTSLWTLTISRDDVILAAGLSLVGGVDILKHLPEIPFNNMYVLDYSGTDSDPSSTSLGTLSKLQIFTDEEISLVSSV